MTDPWQVGAPAKRPKSPWTRGQRILLVLVVLGGVLFVVGAIGFVASMVGGLSGGGVATPGTVERDLGSGEWVIYQRTGTNRGGGGVTFTTDGPPTMSPEEVRVTDPDGNPVRVRLRFENETITLNQAIYHSALSFDAPRSGTYRLEFAQSRGEVLVRRGVLNQFAAAARWLLASVPGALLVVIGGIALIVSRRRSRRALAPPFAPLAGGPGWSGGPVGPGGAAGFGGVAAGAPPAPSAVPGWYPDPTQPGRLRWWNGGAWTEHQS